MVTWQARLLTYNAAIRFRSVLNFLFFAAASWLWRNRRHDVVLHFESKNADYRLIDALPGKRPIPERLFERGKIGRHFLDTGGSQNHIVAGFDGEHHGLREVPLRINACHEEG